MTTLKKLHARFRTWVKGEPRRPAQRQVRLGLEALERRDVPTGGLYPVVSAWYGGNYYLFGLTANGQVEASSNWGGSWYAVTGSVTVATSLVAADGGLYILATNGAVNQTVWQYSGSGSNWTPVTGSSTNATELVGALGNLYMLGSNGAANQTVWQYGGSGSSWTPITAGYTNATALVGNGGLYMLATNGAANETVWQYNGSGSNWTPLTGSSTNATALVGAGGGVYMLGSNGPANETVWQYSGSGSNWTAVTGSSTQALQIISGSGNLYMVGDNGGTPLVWQYSGSGTSWTQLTGASLQNALATWGLAISHPVADTAYSPAPTTDTLFGPYGASYLDVEQGAVGDCWLMASLAETAARTCDISNMFVYDGTTTENGSTVGVYSVRFYTSSGVAQYVSVDTELPSGGTYYDRPVNGVLWAALAEKAYAEATGRGYVSSHGKYDNAYDVLNGGDAAQALQAITGQSANDYYTNPSDVINAWNAGQLIVLNTTTPTSSYIVSSHCYALVNYTASAGLPFEIYNPWGTNSSGWAPGYSNDKYGLFIANGAFVSQNFASESFGTGAAPGGHPGRPGTAGGSKAGFAGLGANDSIFNDLWRFSADGFAPLNTFVTVVGNDARRPSGKLDSLQGSWGEGATQYISLTVDASQPDRATCCPRTRPIVRAITIRVMAPPVSETACDRTKAESALDLPAFPCETNE
jgi:hypothetical protein